MSTANAPMKTDEFTHLSWSDQSKPRAGQRRFLYHMPFGKKGTAGIGHELMNLYTLLAEAFYLGRSAIISPLLLTGRHNDGVHLETEWEKYIDINSFEQIVKVCPSNFIKSVRFDTIRRVNKSHLPRTLLNERAQLIVREFSEPNAFQLLDSIKNSTDLVKKLDRLTKPSSAVMELAEKIRSQLGDYDCMHVRRTDMLTHFKYPNLDTQTRPEYILKRISGWIEKGRKLYIMSDERDPQFFRPLSPFYDVHTIFDFPELLALRVSGDNYLAFEIEKILFKSARIKIRTFKSDWDRSELSLVDYSTRGKVTFGRIASWAKSTSSKLLWSCYKAGSKWRLKRLRRDRNYQQLIARIREVVRMRLPKDASVIMLGDCDDELLQLNNRQTWSLPYVPDIEQERLFAKGVQGARDAPWLRKGYLYEFRLYAGEHHQRRLATARVIHGREAYYSTFPALDLQDSKAVLTAQPVPVPPGSEFGKATIRWNSGDGSQGQVYIGRKDINAPYPTNSATVLTQLKELISQGADYLLVPRSAFRFLEQYPELKEHLERHHQLLALKENVCLIYDLRESPHPSDLVVTRR